MPNSFKPLWRTKKRKNMSWTEVSQKVFENYGTKIPRGTKAAMIRGDPIESEWIEMIRETLKVSMTDVIETVEDKLEISAGDYTVSVMGRSGAGKSSLLNKLFHTDFITSAVEEGTRQLYSAHITVDGLDVCVIDSPGTGASEENDKKYLPLYKELLTQSDCIIWVLQADVRADSGWQRMILALRKYVKSDCNIIFCVNQADKLGCDALERWPLDSDPDKEILRSLDVRCIEVLDRAREVCFMPTSGTVLPCSVVRNYNLDRLYQMIFNKNYFHRRNIGGSNK